MISCQSVNLIIWACTFVLPLLKKTTKSQCLERKPNQPWLVFMRVLYPVRSAICSVGFLEGKERRIRRETHGARREPTTNSTSIWHWAGIEPKRRALSPVRYNCHPCSLSQFWQIGHFRVLLCLSSKASLSAKPFLGKWLWFAWKWNCMQSSFSYERFQSQFLLKWSFNFKKTLINHRLWM